MVSDNSNIQWKFLRKIKYRAWVSKSEQGILKIVTNSRWITLIIMVENSTSLLNLKWSSEKYKTDNTPIGQNKINVDLL